MFIPGISVRPARSTTRSVPEVGGVSPRDTSTMRSPSITTVAPVGGPSSRRTFPLVSRRRPIGTPLVSHWYSPREVQSEPLLRNRTTSEGGVQIVARRNRPPSWQTPTQRRRSKENLAQPRSEFEQGRKAGQRVGARWAGYSPRTGGPGTLPSTTPAAPKALGSKTFEGTLKIVHHRRQLCCAGPPVPSRPVASDGLRVDGHRGRDVEAGRSRHGRRRAARCLRWLDSWAPGTRDLVTGLARPGTLRVPGSSRNPKGCPSGLTGGGSAFACRC